MPRRAGAGSGAKDGFVSKKKGQPGKSASSVCNKVIPEKSLIALFGYADIWGSATLITFTRFVGNENDR